MNNAMRYTLRQFWRSAAASWLLYCVVTMAATWPLARAPLTTLPLGPVDSPVVPMLNLWTIWWNAEQATHAFQNYWQAPIFAPSTSAFAFSEPQPTTLLVAPVIWVTGSRILAYNVYYGLSFLLNAFLTERLLRLQGVCRLLARCGGIAMLLLPILHWQRDVLQLVPVWGIVWVWITFVKLSRESRLRHGIELGVAAATTSLMCMHYGLFAACLAAGIGWVMVRRWGQLSTWRAWMAGCVVALLLAGPMIWHVQRVLDAHEFVREPSLVAKLSIRAGDYTAAHGQSLLPLGRMAARTNWKMSPGWMKVGWAGLGIVCGLARRRTRRWTLFLALTGGVACLLSLGTNIHWGESSIWETCCRIVPGLKQVRSAYRFVVFVQMTTVLLSVQALHLVSMWSRIRFRNSVIAVRVVVPLFALVLAFETLPWRTRIWTVPDVQRHQGWIEYVKRNTPPGRAVLCLPFPTGSTVSDFEATTNWMYFGTFHQVPLVNGYSGFFPKEELQLRGDLARTGVTPEMLTRFWNSEVEYLITDSHVSDESVDIPSGNAELMVNRVWNDPTSVRIYRIRLRK